MRTRLGSAHNHPVHVIALAVVLAATLPVAGGFAQNTELRPLLDRLERAERDIRTLNQQIAGGRGAALPRGGTVGATAAGPSGGPAVARLNVRLVDLESQIRALTGRAEGLDHRLDQIDRRLEKLVGDVDYRLGVLERVAAQRAAAAQAPAATLPPAAAAALPPAVEKAVPGSGESGFATPPQTLGTISQSDLAEFAARRSATGPPGTRPDPQAADQAAALAGALPEGTAKERYQHARMLLFAQKYDQAELVLRAFLEVHPDDPLALNARYWLGETYYVRQDFVRAAEVFLKGYQAAPKGPKAPDTLFKLGMSLANLDKRSEACAAFDKLKQDFPELSDNIENVVIKQRLRNDCV